MVSSPDLKSGGRRFKSCSVPQAGDVLGSPEFNFTADLVKKLTGSPPTSWEF